MEEGRLHACPPMGAPTYDGGTYDGGTYGGGQTTRVPSTNRVAPTTWSEALLLDAMQELEEMIATF